MQNKKRFLDYARNDRSGARNNLQHTHFIGVSVPLDLEDLVNDCRDYMNATFGCKSGYGTPPHVTLVAPFSLNEQFSDADVCEAAANAFEECVQKNVFPFTAKVSGFGSFAERTLFINVEDNPNWQNAHSIFTKTFGEEILFQTKKSGRKFFPHLTIANRDIPAGAMDSALKHFAELDLQTEFQVDTVCIYTRSARGGWVEARRISV